MFGAYTAVGREGRPALRDRLEATIRGPYPARVESPLEPCPHLLAARPGPLPFSERLELGDARGVTEVVVACDRCGATALLELLDWAGPRTELRVFRASGIPRALVDEFAGQAGRPSCDLRRGERELEAFLAGAGPVRGLLAWNLERGELLAAREVAPGDAVPLGVWSEVMPAPEDTRWFELLGIPKA